MLLAVRISSYGCTREVWRALKKLELHSAIASCNSYASFVLSKLPASSITRYTHAKHEQILNYSIIYLIYHSKKFISSRDNLDVN